MLGWSQYWQMLHSADKTKVTHIRFRDSQYLPGIKKWENDLDELKTVIEWRNCWRMMLLWRFTRKLGHSVIRAADVNKLLFSSLDFLKMIRLQDQKLTGSRDTDDNRSSLCMCRRLPLTRVCVCRDLDDHQVRPLMRHFVNWHCMMLRKPCTKIWRGWSTLLNQSTKQWVCISFLFPSYGWCLVSVTSSSSSSEIISGDKS